MSYKDQIYNCVRCFRSYPYLGYWGKCPRCKNKMNLRTDKPLFDSTLGLIVDMLGFLWVTEYLWMDDCKSMKACEELIDGHLEIFIPNDSP